MDTPTTLIGSRISLTSGVLAASNKSIVIREEEYESYVRSNKVSSCLVLQKQNHSHTHDVAIDIDNIDSQTKHMIGPWCIEDEKNSLIGKGAFSRVYKAVDYTFIDHQNIKKNIVLVAIKIINIDNSDTSDKKQLSQTFWMAKNEIDCLSKISHPNVIKMISYDLNATFGDQSVIAFVLEYAPNGNLRSLVAELGGLPEPVANTFLHHIVSGLMACHDVGAVHRDLKLDNIVLDSRFIAKICDFGLAKVKTIHLYIYMCKIEMHEHKIRALLDRNYRLFVCVAQSLLLCYYILFSHRTIKITL